MTSQETLPRNAFIPGPREAADEPQISLGMSLAMATTLTVVWAAEFTVGLTLSLGELVARPRTPVA